MPKAGITYGPRIQAPDYSAIAEQAKAALIEEIGGRKKSGVIYIPPEDLLVRAAQIIEQADAELAVYLKERDQALAHLWFYEARLGLAASAGLTNRGYRFALSKLLFGDKNRELPTAGSSEELAEIGKALGVVRIEGAEQHLLKAAPLVHAAQTRRAEAVRFMQDAVLTLSKPPYEWSPEQIAERAGVDRKIIYKQRAAARKREAE
ncbi:hypothetical protein HHL19_35700 [Streptomyces sp. R302]|uniref:hypothetical protein n=1 Tax=unclassified Streptomyces TaxID=2593676 RepID=UPI00145E13FB|nr:MULTISPECIES: hypothetical protein [unclassified Streptomyces]NML55115.1 hypothetical protein [Streptomyces sp. R301]NML83855.1 hypothetical protein [Streptomyces sp. R302]